MTRGLRCVKVERGKPETKRIKYMSVGVLLTSCIKTRKNEDQQRSCRCVSTTKRNMEYKKI
ncbi:hypothetical protein TOT_040000260 [Theileria orientalis strain Shintoku]|uniref:Uncharacterized protein n=1 Tax=Theileria orientalis strain Shintoku TaxID=869250 RepID=J4DAC2_THEOR|nr:hypothetical protein TOT_040000260 [Theileria orientalis strain Shintoku]BAM41880.1 hypothetical protein TOT_040000260 [Theileria orientalis strain Shintoku]|eukprot:XP_009692181.1 hypothetical protein TOT_040000260 [Theileria orientalis strain Shintoku]